MRPGSFATAAALPGGIYAAPTHHPYLCCYYLFQKFQILLNQLHPLLHAVAAAQRVSGGVEREVQQFVHRGGGHMQPRIAA